MHWFRFGRGLLSDMACMAKRDAQEWSTHVNSCALPGVRPGFPHYSRRCVNHGLRMWPRVPVATATLRSGTTIELQW